MAPTPDYLGNEDRHKVLQKSGLVRFPEMNLPIRSRLCCHGKSAKNDEKKAHRGLEAAAGT